MSPPGFLKLRKKRRDRNEKVISVCSNPTFMSPPGAHSSDELWQLQLLQVEVFEKSWCYK